MVSEYQYPMSVRVFVSIFLTLVASLGIFGNAFVCIIFVIKKNLRSSINKVVFSLALADILQSCNMVFMIVSVNYGKWILGQVMCEINGFITIAFIVTSLIHLFLISLNRYVMVCKPAKKKLLSKKIVMSCIIVSWIYPAILGICPLLGWSHYEYRPGKLICTIRFNSSVSYTVVMISSALLIPFTGICFCYFKIMKVINQNRKRVENMGNNVTVQRKKEEFRVAVMLGVVILSFMVFYAPAGGANLAELALGSEYELPIALDLPFVLLAMLNHANNPIIYGFMNEKFKDAILTCFRNRKEKKGIGISIDQKTKEQNSSNPRRKITPREPINLVDNANIVDTSNPC